MKKTIFTFICLISAFLISANCLGFINYTEVGEIQVIAQSLNVRKGPGLEYEIIGQLSKGDILKVLGEEQGWYLVCISDGSYGCVYGLLTTPLDSSQPGFLKPPEIIQGSDEEDKPISETELLFSLTNEARQENNLEPFMWDDELNEIALKKCLDMIENNYFGHESPVYGTPFKMLKQLGVEYGCATENLASASKTDTAFERIMASPAHRSSVLNNQYNRIGVAVVPTSEYSRMIVQIFVGK